MYKINLLSSNKTKAVLLTLLIIIFVFVTIILPCFFIVFIPQSILGTLLTLNINYILFALPILFYFVYIGVFIFLIRIDPYIVSVSSYRSISSFFHKKDYIDISHLMLKEYAFFNRTFSFNKTLMVKIKTDSNKIVSKRFTLTLLSKKEEKRISKELDQILLNNSKWKRKT